MDGYDFLVRLRSETGWDEEFARRATTEYKKFIYLICVAGRRLAPSPVVDEVWHLHILWTQDYCERFCAATLGRMVHHHPSSNGMTEELVRDYRATHSLYQEEFGSVPPPDFWLHADKSSIDTVKTGTFLGFRVIYLEIAIMTAVLIGLIILAWNLSPQSRKPLGVLTIVGAAIYLAVRNRNATKTGDGCSAGGGNSCGGHGCGGHGCGGD